MKIIKNGVTNSEQKEIFESQIFECHVYDIEIFSIYDDLRRKYPDDGGVKINNDIENSTFIEDLELSTVKALESEGVYLSKDPENRHYILPSTFNSYFHLLAWKLLTINHYKVEALLTYQSEKYLGNYYAQKDNFCGLVEFYVFQFVCANNYLSEDIRLNKISNWVQQERANKKQSDMANILVKENHGDEHLLSIPTKATPEQILNFWLILRGKNEKGEPYWESEQEICLFVNQNFEGFKGVDAIKEFNPNMNKTELSHVTWVFFSKYGQNKTKPQYEKLLTKNFPIFKKDEHVYSNIKNRSNPGLIKLYKELP